MDWLEEAEMKETKEIAELVSRLEYLIGNECYNPNSHNGWTNEDGCSFRYPVTYENAAGEEERTRSSICGLRKDRIGTVKYKFGSNQLYIGNGILAVLEYLEQNYHLDFNELTRKSGRK